MTNGLTTI